MWESLGRVWGISVCCVWERLGLVWGNKFVLCVRELGVGFGNDCVLFVGEFGAGLWERDFAVCGTVWCGFGGVSMCSVGQFASSLGV